MKGQKIKKLLISACIISPMVLFGVVAVLANYTGPNRTVTTTVWERQNCQYRAYVASPSGYCYLTLYYPPSSCPSTSSVADYFNNAPTSCGSSWPGTCGSSISCTITQLNNSTEGCSSGQPGCTSHTSTTTYPPATVNGTTVCTLPGNAGWCRGTATLHLSGNEPLAPAYSLTFFEGSLGTLCNSPSCTWTFPEGNTSFNYWVHSTFGDTSTMASASMLVDSVAPTLTLTIPPPDGANGWFISGPVSASASATDATSGVSGSPSINGGGASFKATTDGIYNLTATVSDVAGNTVSSSGTIRLDTTPPGLSVEGNPTTPDGSNNWYVSPLVLTGTASDATSGIAGVQYQVDGGSWQNGSSLSEGADGTHTIVFRTSDNAGNTATSVPMTVSIDRTAPNPDASLSPSSPDGANGWYVSPVTLTASSSDATSGLASQGVSLDGTTWTPSVTVSIDGTYTVQVHAQDNAGNTASSTKTIRLDTTPPTASILLPPADGNNGWHVTPVTVTAGGTDVTSGVESLLVSLDGNTWAPSLILSADGVYTVQARVTDNAGNATTVSQTIYIDRAPPVISPPVLTGTTGLAGWYTSSVGISVSATDAMSGVASTQYSVDGGAWQTTAPTLLDGVHIVQIRVTDNAGNTSTISGTIKIDSTPPSLDVSVPTVDGLNGWYKSPVTLTASASDATSGLADLQYRVDGGSWTIGTSISVSDGVHTVDFHAHDVAGNQVSSGQTVSVDTTPPSLTVSLPIPQGFYNWYTSAPQITATGSDSGSGVSGFTYSVDGGTWQSGPLTLTDGQHTIDTRITDNAGNYTSSTNAVKVDTTPPQSRFYLTAEGSTTVIQISFSMNRLDLRPDLRISVPPKSRWMAAQPGKACLSIPAVRGRRPGIRMRPERHVYDSRCALRPWLATRNILPDHIVVGNQAPSVSITPVWFDCGRLRRISIRRTSCQIAGARISISDPQGRCRTHL